MLKPRHTILMTYAHAKMKVIGLLAKGYFGNRRTGGQTDTTDHYTCPAKAVGNCIKVQ